MLTQATIDELDLPDSRMRIVLNVQGQRTVLTVYQSGRLVARPGDHIQVDVRADKREWWIASLTYPTDDGPRTVSTPLLIDAAPDNDSLLTAMRTP